MAVLGLSETPTEGREVTRYLAVMDPKKKKIDYSGTGLFFVITANDTPALLRLGVDVHDTSMKAGVRVRGDNELLKVGFRKGRRFALRVLQETKDE